MMMKQLWHGPTCLTTVSYAPPPHHHAPDYWWKHSSQPAAWSQPAVNDAAHLHKYITIIFFECIMFVHCSPAWNDAANLHNLHNIIIIMILFACIIYVKLSLAIPTGFTVSAICSSLTP